MTELHDRDRAFDEVLPDDDRHQQDKDDRAQGLDRDPEPPDDEQPPPLDVEAVRAAWEMSRDEPKRVGPSTRAVLDALPAALDEIEELRRELAYWRGLPLHSEYAITNGDHPDMASVIWPGSAEDALRLAAEDETRQGWVRSVTVHGWVEFDDKPPF